MGKAVKVMLVQYNLYNIASNLLRYNRVNIRMTTANLTMLYKFIYKTT